MILSRKRKRTTRDSQTDEDSCNNMAEALADINRKLDVALARIQEIEEIKEKERQMEKETVTQKKGLNLHISQLRNKLKEQILLRKPYPSLLKEFES